MPRQIDFEGRQIEVPDDFTDDDISQVLASGSPAAAPVAAPPAPSMHTSGFTAPAADQNLRNAEPTPIMDGLRSALRSLQVGAQGTGAGLANTALAPFDLVAGVQNLATKGVNYAFDTNIPMATPASQWAKEMSSTAFEAAGGKIIPKEAMSDKEKLAYNISDYGTQAATMGTGLAARGAVRATEIAQGSANRLGDAFVRPYYGNAPSVVAGDIAGGVGSGVAVNAVEDMVPKDSLWAPLATMGAAAGGGVAGSTIKAAAGGALNMGREGLARAFSPNDPKILPDPKTLQPVLRTESEKAGRLMQEIASNPGTAARNIRDNADQMRSENLPQPTVGLVSGDVGLQSAESAARTKNGVPFIENDNRLRVAATDRVNSLRDPGADQTQPAAVARTEAALQTNETRTAGQAQVRQAETDAAAVVAPARQAATAAEQHVAGADAAQQQFAAPIAARANTDAKAQASRQLDTAIVDEGYLPARTEKNRQFDTAPGRAEQLPADRVFAAVDDVVRRNNELRPDAQLPQDFVTRINQLRPRMVEDPITGQMVNEGGPGTALGGDLADTRKYLTTAYERAEKAGNFDMADSIAALRRAINETITEAPGYTEANANYTQFAERYRPSRNDEAAKFTREIDRDGGRGNTPPTETAGRFLAGPEKTQALTRMMEGTGGEAAVRDYLRSDFGMSALNPNGTLNPNRAAAWARNNADTLAQFPALRGEFDQMVTTARNGQQLSATARANLDTAREGVTAAERSGTDIVRGAERTASQAVKRTEQEVERSVAGTLMREDPRDVAKRIFTSKSYGAEKELDDVQKLIGGDAQAKRGWKAAVSEVLSDQVSGTAKLDAGTAGPGSTMRVELSKLDKMFADNRAIMAKVYDPAEMSRLQQAHSVLEPLKNATVRATGGSNTADKGQQLWRMAEAGLKAKYGVLKGGGYLRTLRVMAQTLPDDSAAVQRLVERAWFDPDIAEYLLTKQVRDMSADASNKHVRRLIAGAAASRESD